MVQGIAADLDCLTRQVEGIALGNGIFPKRYTRNGLSCEQQLALLRSTVAIIGCGGLGGRCAEILARLGVGRLILTDPDRFSESNLNRQIFCNTKYLNCNKVEVLARELKGINPTMEISRHCNAFDNSSTQQAEVVVDALDSAEARKRLSALCSSDNIPLVHAAVNRWYGKVGLDKQQNSSLIEKHYPGQKEAEQTPTVLPMTVALVAAMQATEVCKLIIHCGQSLNRGWLQADLLENEYETIHLNE